MISEQSLSSESRDIREKVVVRLFESSDSLHELTKLINHAYQDLAKMNLNYLATTQDEEVTQRRIADDECWCAEIDGNLVGTILLRKPKNKVKNRWYTLRWCSRPGIATFSQFAVDPSMQRRGVGAILLKTIEHRAQEVGALELACNTATQAKHLIRMYIKRGYRRVDYISWRNTNYYSVVLSKFLDADQRRIGIGTRLIENLRFYCNIVITRCMRRADGKARFWVPVGQKLKS